MRGYLLRVGKPLPRASPICVGEECRVCREKVRVGEVIEIVYRVEPGINKTAIWRFVDLLSKVREKFPNISFLYIEVSWDGKIVRMQVADPREEMGIWTIVAAIVVVIAALIALIYMTKVLVDAVYRTLSELPSPRTGTGKVVWIGLGIALAGAGIGVAAFGVSRFVGGGGWRWRRIS